MNTWTKFNLVFTLAVLCFNIFLFFKMLELNRQVTQGIYCTKVLDTVTCDIRPIHIKGYVTRGVQTFQ